MTTTEVTIEKTVEETDEINICDECGREASDALTFEPTGKSRNYVSEPLHFCDEDCVDAFRATQPRAKAADGQDDETDRKTFVLRDPVTPPLIMGLVGIIGGLIYSEIAPPIPGAVEVLLACMPITVLLLGLFGPPVVRRLKSAGKRLWAPYDETSKYSIPSDLFIVALGFIPVMGIGSAMGSYLAGIHSADNTALHVAHAALVAQITSLLIVTHWDASVTIVTTVGGLLEWILLSILIGVFVGSMGAR